jgi:hypothetical protein
MAMAMATIVVGFVVIAAVVVILDRPLPCR